MDWKQVEHFSRSEFECGCGCGQGADRMQPEFVDMLDATRSEANMPFKITSGYRCPEHNAEIGGVSSSSHVRGYAADLACKGSRSRAKILQAAIDVGFNRIGIGKDFIHLDCDPDKPKDVFWLY